MFYYYDPTYWLIILGAIVALYAQIKVSTTYSKWSKVPSSTRMTGAQMARQILDGNGCENVRIECISGKLTDHYDPENGVLRLSSEVYGSDSVAALGVAAHEAGHAIQDAQDYAPLRIRSTMVPTRSCIRPPSTSAGIPMWSAARSCSTTKKPATRSRSCRTPPARCHPRSTRGWTSAA